ncbi:hypothetical protein Btru_004151 [Bulinus truncatus]|nr:hypothetical protein Btru_004151 [Bulinus truncatus]
MSSIPVQELEYHYSPSRWSHRMSRDEVLSAHIEALAQGSRNALWTLDSETEIAYGQSERQKLDIFYKKNSAKKGAPIFMYFHGGYWQTKEIGREISSFSAVPLCNAGASVISVGFDLAPDVSLNSILLQAKKALHLVIKLAKERQSSGIYLAGHSAGAHIAAMLLMTSLSQYDSFDCELVKGAVLISGVYDLRPLVKTTINEPLKLTEEDAWRFSPQNFVQEIAHQSQQRHIIIAVGEYDPPEFRRQSGEMEQMLRNFGVKTSYLDIPDVDHFNVVEKLSETYYVLTQECIRLMGL